MAKNKTAEQLETSRFFWRLITHFGVCILAVAVFLIVWGELSSAIATIAFAAIVWGVTFLVMKVTKQL